MKDIKEFENKIINGDCFDILKEIPDKSIDLILTDPPYKLDWKQSINFKDRKSMYHHKEDTEKWDKGFNIKEFYNVLFPIFDRIVKNSGSVLIFTRNEYISYAVDSAKANNFDDKATITWHKTNPMPQVRKRHYLSSTESILWVARYDEKKCLFTFNFKTQNEMHNFIETPICGGKERSEHPTQKPLKLIKHLLEIHSNEKDLVLDPFLGSGTTAVSCKELGRNYIGIEKEEKYIKISEQRVKQVIGQQLDMI